MTREEERLRFEAHYDDWAGLKSGTAKSLRLLDTYTGCFKMSAAWVHWKAAVGIPDQEKPA